MGTTSAPTRTGTTRGRHRRRRDGGRMRAIAVALLLVTGAVVGRSAPGEAAGITTHGWMAVEAIDQVADPQLHALLAAHVEQVRAGASFPDVGYVAGNTYGEEAHWQRFVDAYLALIVAKPGCGELTDPDGPCADLIAHAFGVAAHGMGDQVWDWLFEPYSPDLDEYWTDPDVPTATESGAETQMDLVAIDRYGVPRPETPPLPDVPLLVQAFADSGMSGVDASQFSLVPNLPVLWDVEKGWADAHLAEVETAMPWMSANMVTAPGGVQFAATAIAGYWSTMWGVVTGDPVPTSVSITYPADGQTGVPVTGWDRASFQPGSSRGRGGATNRITAVLTSSRPYRDASGAGGVPQELPEGSMTITDLSDGSAVALKAGYPRSVPYGADAGEHLIDVQPAADLAACTWYRVDVGVSADLSDARHQPVRPYSWSFQTACAEEPPTTTTPTSTTTTTVAPSGGATTTLPSPATPPAVPGSASAHRRPLDIVPSAVAVPVQAEPTYAG